MEFLLAANLLNFLLQIWSTSATTTVHINAASGNDSHCLPPGLTPCKSLEFVAGAFHGESNFSIIIETDIHLNDTVIFGNVFHIAIIGQSNIESHYAIKKVQCSHHSQAGVVVNNVTNFSITNLDFNHCGSFIRDRCYETAILFNQSSNIVLTNTTLRKSHSTGAVFLSCYGHIILTSVYLYSNGAKKTYISYPAGISVEVTGRNKSVHYSFYFCIFNDNMGAARVWHSSNVTKNCLNNSPIRLHKVGMGGGLGVFVSNSSGNSVSIQHCKFWRNRADVGGGMSVQFQGFSYNNSVVVERAMFTKNSAEFGGGGCKIFYLMLGSGPNKVQFKEVTMNGNVANYGGAIAINSKYGDSRYYPYDSMVFTGCRFYDNIAVFSPAIDITPYTERSDDKSGFLPIPVFVDVDISGNYIVQNGSHSVLKKAFHINSGVFSITLFTVCFSGLVNVCHNSYSALNLISATVVFEANTISHFSNNTGSNGGAIAMYGFSSILTMDNVHFYFLRNTAEQYGAGIFHLTIDQHDFLSGTACFIEYIGSPELNVSRRNVTFFFEGNQAKSGGSSIYAYSFLNCIHVCDNRKDFYSHCIGNFTFNDCNNKTHDNNCSYLQGSGHDIHFDDYTKDYKVIPGMQMSIPFVITDDYYQPIHPLMSLEVATRESPIEVQPPYTLSNDIHPYGPPNKTATLKFAAQGIAGVYFQFNVTMLGCPPGFLFNASTKACECASKTEYSAIVDCNYDDYQALIKPNYWAGYIPTTEREFENLYFAPCFLSLCKQIDYLPNSSMKLDSEICKNNRTGIMCGNCVANYSVYYHSRDFACYSDHLCHFGIPFYILSETIPTVVLFLLVVILDFSFTSGSMVSFIFFFQYLNKLTIHVNTSLHYLREPYRLFYGLFNFEYFVFEPLSFCLWKNAQILDVIVFKYITILAAFFLVIILVILLRNNYCVQVLKWRSKISTKISVVNGLSAFLVVCYSQCTKTSLLILKPVTPTGINGTTTGTFSFYGGLPYFQGRHLMYAVPALFSLLFVTILPPLVLLLYPLSLHLLSLCGLSEHWLVNMTLRLTGINKLKPFIDCFQSCYKDRLRFFAGLFFVYRVAILLLYSMIPDSVEFSMYSGVLLLLIIGIHSSLQPFKVETHNTADSLILLNLALINSCVLVSKYLVDQPTNLNQRTKDDTFIVVVNAFQLVLLYLPIVAFIVHLVRTGITYIKTRKGVSEIAVDDILVHDSEHTVIDDGKQMSTSLRNTYGSIQDTY